MAFLVEAHAVVLPITTRTAATTDALFRISPLVDDDRTAVRRSA
ncbi:hypothetical protein [Nannocystis punicea]|uniref:Uncharacterized protein n=1 Tax=Nannocystis punicea TaxID=2995304 RepID=A0ABY7H684_9BACT|nr:hypothetical protein [Nannocystis poenicansa]WAS94797.1 hypothetical protein O0S08_01440 [Nannocystis poenicansa]